jgi:hypothetical protein
MVVNSEQVKIRKAAVVVYFKVPSRYSPRATEE